MITYKHIENLEAYEKRQQNIYNNKAKHGFNLTDPYQEVRYMLEETAELMHAIEKKDTDNAGEELADIVIFAYGLAEILGIKDLDAQIFAKMKINEKRKYKVNNEGDFEKIE